MKNCDPEIGRSYVRQIGEKLEGCRTVRVRTRVGHSKNACSCEPQFGMNLILAREKYKTLQIPQEICEKYNFCPYMLVPLLPVPVGSPPWIMKS